MGGVIRVDATGFGFTLPLPLPAIRVVFIQLLLPTKNSYSLVFPHSYFVPDQQRLAHGIRRQYVFFLRSPFCWATQKAGPPTDRARCVYRARCFVFTLHNTSGSPIPYGEEQRERRGQDRYRRHRLGNGRTGSTFDFFLGGRISFLCFLLAKFDIRDKIPRRQNVPICARPNDLTVSLPLSSIPRP